MDELSEIYAAGERPSNYDDRGAGIIKPLQLIVVNCTTLVEQDNGEERLVTQVVGVFANMSDAEHAADDYATDYRDENYEDLSDDSFTYTMVTDVGTPTGQTWKP
jgi:hypothetical protein